MSLKVEVGSGYNPDLSFDYHIDLNPKCPHLEHVGSADDLSMFADDSVDEIKARDILEHFSYRDTIRVLKEWRRVLKPGGRIYIQCPDAKLIALRWLHGDLPVFTENGIQMPIDYSASYWICGGQKDGTFVRGDDDWRYNAHYVLFSSDSLEFYLRQAGFSEQIIRSDGGSNLTCWAIK